MIVGRKPSGFTVGLDLSGNKVELETRQCVHCQFTWTYKPGSGVTRGFCLKCFGLLCARPECMSVNRDCKGPYEKGIDL